MESLFGATPPKLDITTTTGRGARAEQDCFRHFFVGAMLGLRSPSPAGTVHETLEYLAFASMLMRRLDRAEGKLG